MTTLLLANRWKPFRLRRGSGQDKVWFTRQVSEKIFEILSYVNGRSTFHTYTSALDISQCVDSADERRVRLGLSKRNARGMRVTCISGQRVSASYQYSRTGTKVVLVYRPSGWFLESVTSVQLYPEDGGGVEPILTLSQTKLVLEKYQSEQFRVARRSVTGADAPSRRDLPLHIDCHGDIDVEIDGFAGYSHL